MRPSIGEIVHYVSLGNECRAAIVTEVHADPAVSAGLCVLNPAGMFFNRAVAYHEGRRPDASEPSALCNGLCFHGGTWHWAEGVQGPPPQS
jgi:hypothetical protein